MISKFAPETQRAFELNEASRDGSFQAGDVLLCVPIAAARAKPLPGDLIVIETASEAGTDLATLVNGSLVSLFSGTLCTPSPTVRSHWLAIAVQRPLDSAEPYQSDAGGTVEPAPFAVPVARTSTADPFRSA
ncbi:MAG: hypothetical protein AB1749_11585 [Pseudomonadota bacterium]